MPDKFEREIEDILNKLDRFPSQRPTDRARSAVTRRISGFQRGVAARLSRISISQIMLTGIVLLFLVGLLTFDQIWRAALPAGIYLAIHLAEGEVLTPMLLAKRFVLNQILVILSIVFWYWMWGIPGALLAVPMLAILKIVCDRIGPLMALGHFLGGAPRT